MIYKGQEITKESVSSAYHKAVLIFKQARDDEEEWNTYREVARLECVAEGAFGLAFADAMHESEFSALS